MAEGYDEGFTHSAIGRLMREAVWERVDAVFQPGNQILELGCGTGEDAVHLACRGATVLATDVSAGMLAVTRAKVARLGLQNAVVVERLDLAELARYGREGARSRSPGLRVSRSPGLPVSGSPGLQGSRSPGLPVSRSARYDGVFSNFGALNCAADLGGVAAGLAGLLRPGAPAMLCIMGPVVPWEWGWYLARGELGRAFRRLRPGGVTWRGLTIGYPSIGALRRTFAPWFACERVAAVGALVPPSYVEGWAAARPGLLWALHRLERRYATAPPLPWLADHYLVELRRK